jgi:RNA recognition motif-containing protein
VAIGVNGEFVGQLRRVQVSPSRSEPFLHNSKPWSLESFKADWIDPAAAAGTSVANTNINDININDDDHHKKLSTVGDKETFQPDAQELLLSTIDPPLKTLWIGRVDSSISEKQVRDAFSSFGTIERLVMLPTRSCAFVTFTTCKAALQAKTAMHRAAIVPSKRIFVSFLKKK